MEVKMRLTAMKLRYIFLLFSIIVSRQTVFSNTATVLIVNLLEMYIHQVWIGMNFHPYFFFQKVYYFIVTAENNEIN
jgi:hypothetical protein